MEYIDLNLKNYPNTFDRTIPAGLNFLINFAILLNYANNKYDDLDLSYDENSQTLKIITHRGVISTNNFLYNDTSYNNWLLRNAISSLAFNDVSLSFTSSEGIFKVVIKDKQDLSEQIPSIFVSKQDVKLTTNWISLKDFADQVNNNATAKTTIIAHPISLLDLKQVIPNFSFLQSYQAIINTKNNKLLVPKQNELTYIYLNGVRNADFDAGKQDLNKVHLIYGYDFDMHLQYLNNTQDDFQTNGRIMSKVLEELDEQQAKTYFPAIFNNPNSYEWGSYLVQDIVTLAMNKFFPNQYLIYHDGYEYHDFWDIAKQAGKTVVHVKNEAFNYLENEGVRTLYDFVQEYMNKQYPPSKNESNNLNFEEYNNFKLLNTFIDNFVANYPELKEAWKKIELNKLFIAVFSNYPNPYGTFWKEYKIGILVRKNLINLADLLIAGKEIIYQTCNLDRDQFDNKWLEATIDYFMNQCNDLKEALKNSKQAIQNKKPS